MTDFGQTVARRFIAGRCATMIGSEVPKARTSTLTMPSKALCAAVTVFLAKHIG